MQTRKLFLMASCLTVLGLLLASCAPAVAPAPTAKPALTPPAQAPAVATPVSKAPTPTPKAAAEQPRYGGTLNISHVGDPGSFDPNQENSVQVQSLVIPCYSGIVQHDPREPNKVIGDLAEKWDMSPDGMAFTFHLYKNVKWHDGYPFTSEDARFALEVVRDPPKGVVSARKEWLNAVDKIEAPDKDTLKITLRHPSAAFLRNLGDGRMAVIPKHVFEAKGSMKKDIVGTGPYKFKSFAPGGSFSVVKNPDYFIRGRPYLDGITWYIVVDPAARYAALRTHRLQVTSLSSGGLTPAQAEIIRKDMSDRITVERYPGLVSFMFVMPHTSAPWSDIRVRRAVELTIDRQKVVKVTTATATSLGGFMTPGSAWALPEAELMKMPGYREPKDADIAEARRLLADAGYGQGIKTSLTTSNRPSYERPAVVVQQQLAGIGIEIAVSLVDYATFYDRALKRAFDTMVYGIGLSFDDPDQVFGQGYISGAARNISNFGDEKIDKWNEEQGRSLDLAKRKQIVLDMQRRLHELIPSSMLCWTDYELGYWKEVKDYRPGIGLFNNLKFQNVWVAQ